MDTVMYFGKAVKISHTIPAEKRARLIEIMREKERTGWREFMTLGNGHGPCADCAINTYIANYYMVTKEIWAAHGAGDGLLCIDCLQARMGRNLTLADFIDCLQARMGRNLTLADFIDCPVNQKFLINRFDFVR